MAWIRPQSKASYTANADQSRGRLHDEPEDPFRNPFELDCHRVGRCSAFRRLEYKTQVFVTLEDDHFRTRLTHTLEVAGIARTLAIALGVDETLAEVVSLAHDLGHPPFGHAGEMALKELMAGAGGFEHNTHSLRIVDYLEHPNPRFRGLNLTYETRECLIKHCTRYDRPASSGTTDSAILELLDSGPLPPIEGQIANVADRLAYDCHDLEDAISAGLLSEQDLADVRLWHRAADPIRNEHPAAVLPAIRKPVLDRLLNELLGDIVAQTRLRLDAAAPKLIDDVRTADDVMVALSDEMAELVNELEAFLVERVYHHHRLVRMDAKARRLIERLFNAYIENPNMLPARFAARIDEQGPHRVVCDYIAGMTDRFCQDDYMRLFEPFERV